MTREEALTIWNEVNMENPFPEGLEASAPQAEHLNNLVVAFAEKLTS